ncbi:MAG: metal ABC transporter substrate-binding protein [Micromonosporaceae bacterium]
MRTRRGATMLLSTLALSTVSVLATAGCARPVADGRVRVVAAFYPLEFVAQRVGGERVAVHNLVRPGTEPHDLDLQPRQIAAIIDADLVVYLGGFQPAVDDVADQQPRRRSLDVASLTPLVSKPSAGVRPGPDADVTKDPHIWLDPVRLHTVAIAVAQRLAAVDPEHAAGYRARADALGADLTELDRAYQDGLAECARREIVTSHAAFGYLAQRYNLRQVAVTGLSPEEEASPARLAQVASTARAAGATTIFFETLASDQVAQTVAKEIGARAAVLDPLEGLAPGSTGDYFTVMRQNLAALRTALGCP